jgi:hypothetical protein
MSRRAALMPTSATWGWLGQKLVTIYMTTATITISDQSPTHKPISLDLPPTNQFLSISHPQTNFSRSPTHKPYSLEYAHIVFCRLVGWGPYGTPLQLRGKSLQTNRWSTILMQTESIKGVWDSNCTLYQWTTMSTSTDTLKYQQTLDHWILYLYISDCN